LHLFRVLSLYRIREGGPKMIGNGQSLLSIAEEFTFQYGIGVIPTNNLKQLIIGKVVDKRGRIVTRVELEDFFGPNGSKKAQYIAILLDSPKPFIALDLDGNWLTKYQ
jgi:hypothetical protein